MSFVSNYIIKNKHSLKALPELFKKHTKQTITQSQTITSYLTQGKNWYYPDGLNTLDELDKISNECCKVIDSALIVYKNYSEGNPTLQSALADTMNEVNDFFGSEYLNLNKRLLTLLYKLQCDPIQQSPMSA